MFAHEFIIDSLPLCFSRLRSKLVQQVFGLSLVIYVPWLFSHPNYRIWCVRARVCVFWSCLVASLSFPYRQIGGGAMTMAVAAARRNTKTMPRIETEINVRYQFT